MEISPLKHLIQTLPQTGKVVSLLVRPARKEPPTPLTTVFADARSGLSGDHFAGKKSKKRQVTLIQAEHIDAVSSMLHCEKIDPLLIRRNIVVSNINLLALKDQTFHIGEAILEGTGYCHPCSRMEENLGPGGYNAMRGHGGITAKIIQSGEIRIGDEIRLCET